MVPRDQLLTALWEAPSDQGSPELDGYVVRWREVTTPESDWTEYVTESADTELDELVNDQEYQVQVAAYHNTAVDAPAGVRVLTVLDAGEVPPAPPAGEQPLAECPTDSQPTADCYVVVQAGNIGPYTGVATATPRALAQEDIAADDPGMPRNLRLTPGVGQITARWDAPSEPDPNHGGYALQYRAEGASRWLDGPRIVYGDTDNDPTTPDIEETRENRSAVITGLEGRAYQVRVASLIAEGAGHVAGGFTAPRTVEAVAPRPPGPPRNLAAVTRISPNDGSRRIEVSWDPPADTGNPAGITGYAVQYRQADAAAWTGWKRPGGESPTGTKATISGVGSGAYSVRVAAIGALGNTGEYAVAAEAQRRPTKVLNLTLTPGDGRIKAEWDAPQDPGSPPIGGYHVSYREDHSPTWQSAGQSGTSKIITGLTNGQLYHVRVSVSNGAGAASVTLPVVPSASGGDPVVDPPPEPEPPDPGPARVPGTPQNLVLTPGDGKLTVTWLPPEDTGNPPLTHYVVEDRLKDAASVPWLDQNVSGTSVVIEGLENGVTYTVRLWAVNAEGRSATVEAHAVPRVPEPEPRLPGPPRDLTLTPGDGHLAVSWTAPADRGHPVVSGYLVQHRADGASDWRELRQSGNTLLLENLENGVTYTIRVWAVNADGAGAGSAEATATPVAPPAPAEGERAPGAPRNLVLTPGDGKLTATWLPPEDPGDPTLTHYVVEDRLKDAPASTPWLDQNVSGTSVVIDGLENGVTYTIRVWAVNAEGSSAMVEADAAPEAPPEEDGDEERAPTAPRNLALAAGDGKMDVSWDAPSDLGNPEIEGYTVEYRADGAESWTSQRATGTSATVTGLENGTEYEVRVRASNEQGEAVAGPKTATPAKAVTQRAPSVPRDLSAALGATWRNWIDISWSAPSDEGDPPFDGYEIHYRRQEASGWTQWLQTADRSRSATFLQLGTAQGEIAYEIRVRAVSDAGKGPFAGPVCVAIVDGACDAGGAGGQGAEDNQPPTANAGPDQSVNEGDSVTLAGSGSDPEGETLTYAWTAPAGITLSDATVASPTFAAPDRTEDYTLTFSLVVNDGSGDSAADTVDISVAADNDAPGAPSLTDRSATVGTVFSYTFAAVADPEGATPTYSALQVASDDTTSVLPGWLAFDAGTRTFSCAASGAGACVAGALTIRVTASDGAAPTPATSSATFTLTVAAAAPANSPPAFGAESYAFDLPENADGSGVDAAIALGTVSATDPDSGDTVEYGITAGNSGSLFAIDGSSGAITYTGSGENFESFADDPNVDDDGPAFAYILTVQASDGAASVTVPVTIRVTDVDEAPTANAGPDQSVTEGDSVTLAGSGTDPEGQALTYAWTAPEGVTLSSSTAANPTFAAPDRDADYTLTFSLVVNDGSSDSAADTVVISVSADQGGGEGDGEASGVPTGFGAARGATHTEAVVSWGPPDDGASPTHYEVQYAEGARFGDAATLRTPDVQGNPPSLSHTVGGLTTGQKYWFRVRAMKDDAAGPWTEGKSARPRAVVTIAPVQDHINEGDAAQFRVSLSPAPEADTAVTVQVAVQGNFGVAGGSRTVTVPAGEDGAILTIATVDGDDEDPGSITARVDRPDGYARGTPNSAVIRVGGGNRRRRRGGRTRKRRAGLRPGGGELRAGQLHRGVDSRQRSPLRGGGSRQRWVRPPISGAVGQGCRPQRWRHIHAFYRQPLLKETHPWQGKSRWGSPTAACSSSPSSCSTWGWAWACSSAPPGGLPFGSWRRR